MAIKEITIYEKNEKTYCENCKPQGGNRGTLVISLPDRVFCSGCGLDFCDITSQPLEMEKATCQVCGREIKASTGLIAHHGYKRPYEGWQTASCEGARYVPYEVSCDRLREVVEMVKKFLTSQEKMLADFLATPPQTIRVFERRSSIGPEKEVVYEKPETFNPKNYYASIPRTYENVYDNRKYSYERTIRMAKLDLSTMERRLREWKAPEQAVREVEGTLQREKARLLADIATAQAHITALLERPLDAEDYQAEQVYSNLADGIARARSRIAEIDAELACQSVLR